VSPLRRTALGFGATASPSVAGPIRGRQRPERAGLAWH